MPMPYTDDERQLIAETVRRTRIDKQLDKEPAARAAKVNSITWKRVEDAEGVRDASLSKVLSSLGLTVESVLHRQRQVVDQVQDSQPDQVTPEAYPAAALNLSKASWRAVNELAESPKDDPNRRAKADRAVLTTADLITDVLLALNVGPTAKPLIQEMAHRAYEVLHLQKEDSNDMETASTAGASGQANEDEEDESLHGSQLSEAARAAGRTLIEGAGTGPGQERRMEGDEDPENPQQISGR